MFTQTLTRRALGSSLIDLLAGPCGIDGYTQLVSGTWSSTEARAKVVKVRRNTPRSVTLTLRPNDVFAGCSTLKAGQYVNLTVDIDGRRRTRCYSPANAEGQQLIELTVGRHDGGLVSTHLYRHAQPGMVVGLAGVGGDFVLPAVRPRRILLVSGGSGITPVMSMLRTLKAEGYPGRQGEIAFVHYARTPEDADYRDELAALNAEPGIRVLHGFTRSPASGQLQGHFDADHLATAMPAPDAVYVCGTPALVSAVREHCDHAVSESFVPPAPAAPAECSGGQVAFLGAKIEVVDDGRSLLDQAESAGLRPTSGCRMGICHTCTCRKTRGTVRNLITGAVSTADDEDIQICVAIPLGDVDLSL